jgi:15-cis-phytoene synthase
MTSKKEIFRKGSRNYFTNSLFFPKETREDVFTFYAFVRIVDDYVDNIPQQKKEFLKFKKQTFKALDGKKVNNLIIDDFIDLYKRKKFRKVWVIAFFDAMESDLNKVCYNNLEDLEKYIYGSAEVIGLFMAKIMNLEKSSYKFAMMLGKSMQYINFIRDFKEDLDKNRIYLPLEHGIKFNLKFNNLNDYSFKDKISFEKFIKSELKIFYDFHNKSILGYKYIPKRLLVPIKTAQDMYLWTAKKIEKNPTRILYEKIKPSKLRILIRLFYNFISL